jgi:predicted unusual protein kinase regulating ubiquinone biosynthesis (AarF/ABC1/UbiB family)
MARKGLGGRVGRGTRLARTGVRGAAGLAGSRARAWRDGTEPDDDAFHREMASHLAEVLGDMKGAAMKLGQLLSFIDLDLPPEVRSVYHEALATLRDQAPAHDPASIDAVLRDEYGAAPEAVFAAWDPEPLASASIGQVHAARTEDGREVVVKVQYPGVAEAVRADLRNAEAFAPIARLVSPNQEVGPLLDELRERIDDELDYEREAQYQRAFANRYRGHPFIHVPDIVGELCRGRVLVSERAHGRRFDDVVADSPPDEQQRVGEIVFRYAFGSMGRFRLFNGDPHPGNYLVEDGAAADGGPRVVFIDYGSVKMFSRERYASMRRVERAVARDDRDDTIDALREAGFVPPGVHIDEERIYEWFRLYTRPVLPEQQPFEFTPEYASEVIRASSDPRSRFGDALRRLNMPPDYLLLNRIQWGLYSVLARLRARNDWGAIRDEYLDDDAPPATALGELDTAWWADHGSGLDPTR